MSSEKQSGVALIAAERQRQIEKEGWTPEHDDSHTNGELAQAAACYALNPSQVWAGDRSESVFAVVDDFVGPNEVPWPWERHAYKRDRDRIRELVKAGALIAAEIDRQNRAAEAAKETGDEHV